MECIACGKLTKNPKFCCRSCSTTTRNSERIRSSESCSKTSQALNEYFIKVGKRRTPERQCQGCGKTFLAKTPKHTQKFCGVECRTKRWQDSTRIHGSAAGRASATKRVIRSKQEVELFDLVKQLYPSAVHNTPIVDGWDADISIPDLKIAILWDGPWHRKEMGFKNHSLKQVKNRDRIKRLALLTQGWTIYTFQDNMFTPHAAFQFLVGTVGLPPTSTPL